MGRIVAIGGGDLSKNIDGKVEKTAVETFEDIETSKRRYYGNGVSYLRIFNYSIWFGKEV